MSLPTLKEDNTMDNTNEDKRQAMIDKISALLTKAEDRGCTAAESEAFFAKAQELMTKWAIDEQMLKLSGKAINEKIVTTKVTLPSTYFAALIWLWVHVARANDCVVLQSKHAGVCRVILTGYESDVANVQLIVTSLTLFASREAQRESKAQGGDYYFRRSFIEGFAHRIGARFQEQRDLNVQDVKATTGTDLLPALVDKRKQVNDFVNSTMNVGRARSSGSRRGSAEGASAGHSAANRADIGNKRVGGTRGSIGR
jgi:hypothetical protein